MKTYAKISYKKGEVPSVPEEIKDFLKRALILFVCWKLLFHLILFPTRFPDKQLTYATANSTTFLYKKLMNEPRVVFKEVNRSGVVSNVIYINRKRAIGIADSCNGLELYVLYIGFLFCFPIDIKRKILFTIAGIAGIFILNAFRCFGLAWLFLNNYSIANFAHHYLFKMVIYAAIFYTWALYCQKYLRNVE